MFLSPLFVYINFTRPNEEQYSNFFLLFLFIFHRRVHFQKIQSFEDVAAEGGGGVQEEEEEMEKKIRSTRGGTDMRMIQRKMDKKTMVMMKKKRG